MEQVIPEQHKEFFLKIAALDAALKAYDKDMGGLLTQIHSQLITIPELSYMLTEEQVGQIVEGNSRTMKIEITATTAKQSAAKQVKNLMKEVSADDF